MRRLRICLASAVTQALLTRMDDFSVTNCRALRLPLDLWQRTLSSYRRQSFVSKQHMREGIAKAGIFCRCPNSIAPVGTVALTTQSSLHEQIPFWVT